MIGAEYVCLEFRDLAIFNDDESRRRVTEALRRVQPAIILTAPPADYIADHEMTSLLVRDACFAASCPNYTTRQWEPAPPLAKIPHLYFVRPRRRASTATDGRCRSTFTSMFLACFATKREMLACHASQRNWLLRQHGIDEYLTMQAKWGARRGAEIGVAQAEAFRQYRGHPYPQDNLLLQTARAGWPGQAGREWPAGRVIDHGMA